MKAKFNRKNQVIVLLDDSELTVLKRLIMVQDAESEEAEIRCLIWAKALELGVWGFEKEPLISVQHLPINLSERHISSVAKTRIKFQEEILSLEEMEKNLLLKALKSSAWNKSQAARILGITRDTLRYKIKKWHIENG